MLTLRMLKRVAMLIGLAATISLTGSCVWGPPIGWYHHDWDGYYDGYYGGYYYRRGHDQDRDHRGDRDRDHYRREEGHRESHERPRR